MASRGSGRKRVTKELSKEDAEREEASAVELGAGDRQNKAGKPMTHATSPLNSGQSAIQRKSMFSRAA